MVQSALEICGKVILSTGFQKRLNLSAKSDKEDFSFGKHVSIIFSDAFFFGGGQKWQNHNSEPENDIRVLNNLQSLSHNSEPSYLSRSNIPSFMRWPHIIARKT